MKVEWKSDQPLPQVGDRVRTQLNGLGDGVVTGYWAELEYLGIMVKLTHPPKWYLKQNDGQNPEGVFFGPEVLRVID